MLHYEIATEVGLTLTFYQFDSTLHRHSRTTNPLEPLFREFRTKSDEIGAFSHETALLHESRKGQIWT
ncbi:MAG: hypothetical protein HC780_26580 [Leptolyngbyaceae cyanobacterium CSU_1_3]|nr:hypothetical protein [Leptolyngbyaceae cyanobacterium CSU_1_3]